MDVSDKISQGEIDGLHSILQQYNEYLETDKIPEAIITGAAIEHSLSTLHFDMVQRVNNLTKKVQ